MISSQSIITKFGGERTTGSPIKFDRNPLLKVALTKELGKNAKLLYKIKMENTYGNKMDPCSQDWS